MATETRGHTRNVIDRIKAERIRQIEAEGFTVEHDDEHCFGEIAGGAVAYAHAAFWQIAHAPMQVEVDRPHQDWNWDNSWWKPSTDPIRNLEKAAALIVAEIERLEREMTPKVTPLAETP